MYLSWPRLFPVTQCTQWQEGTRRGAWAVVLKCGRVATASYGSLTEMQILGSLPRLTSSDNMGLRPSDLCLTSCPGGADALGVCQPLDYKRPNIWVWVFFCSTEQGILDLEYQILIYKMELILAISSFNKCVAHLLSPDSLLDLGIQYKWNRRDLSYERLKSCEGNRHWVWNRATHSSLGTWKKLPQDSDIWNVSWRVRRYREKKRKHGRLS